MSTLREIFLSHNAQTSPSPLLLEFIRAEGIYLFNPEERAYMDFISGIGVSNIGHGNPKVIQAIHEQSKSYLHQMVYGEYIQKPQSLYAQSLANSLPKELSSIYFVNSGSEAIEGAMKLSKRFTGRMELLGFEKSYHGSTQGALSIMGEESFKNAFRPLLPSIKFLRWNYWEDLELITEKTAGVLMETIQGEAGIRIPNSDFLKALRKRCTEFGALLILDEIQCGMGRTGKLFAFQDYSIIPDILVLGKALGGGLPLGAFISSDLIMGSLKENPILGHITTFGGHPLSCAAGLAAFEFLTQSSLMEEIEEKSQLFHALIFHPKVLEIRRKGFMIAIEFEDFEHNKKIIDRCIDQGLIVDWFLHNSKSMRIAPPLITQDFEIIQAAEIIQNSIEWAYS